jgi:hypothetical protein
MLLINIASLLPIHSNHLLLDSFDVSTVHNIYIAAKALSLVHFQEE